MIRIDSASFVPQVNEQEEKALCSVIEKVEWLLEKGGVGGEDHTKLERDLEFFLKVENDLQKARPLSCSWSALHETEERVNKLFTRVQFHHTKVLEALGNVNGFFSSDPLWF